IVDMIYLPMIVYRDLLQAEHVIWIAALDLYLNGCVVDPKITSQFFSHTTQDVLAAAHALFVHHHVTTTTHHPRADRPNVQVVHRHHAMHARNRLFNFGDVHARGNRL